MKKIFLIAVIGFFAAVIGSKQPAAASSLSATSDQNQSAQTPSNVMLSQQKTEKESKDENLDFLMDEEAKEKIVIVPDPLYSFNRVMFQFNDRLYFWVLKPVATVWGAVIPEIFRSGVQNFFYNLRFPQRFISCVLQWKGKKAKAEFDRFLVNTFAGIGGLGNPAKNYPELNPSKEDLGQTFAVWGAGNGFYLVIPLFGPSTLRDGLGIIGDIFLDPSYWIGREVDNLWVTVGLWTGEVINNASFRIGDYEAIKEAAIDPYVAIRNGYIQNRNKLIEE